MSDGLTHGGCGYAPSSLYRRGRVYYCQFWNEHTGRYASGISTRQTDKNAAYAVVAEWQRDGIAGRERRVEQLIEADTVLRYLRAADLTYHDASRIVEELDARGLLRSPDDPASEPLVSFLTRFWDYDASPYVAELTSHKHRKPFFSATPLGAVTKADVRAFSREVGAKLAAKTANNILAAGTVALNWAHGEEIIRSNPAKGLRKLGSDGKGSSRGVLTVEEARTLLSLTWSDDRARVATLVAMTTGLRAGEVAALQRNDIGTDRLHVRHAWSNQDGLKTTKTGKERVVPLLASVRRELLALARKTPHSAKSPHWVFWSTVRSDRPVETKARTATGHATSEMFEHSARHHDEETFREVAQVAQCAFGSFEAG